MKKILILLLAFLFIIACKVESDVSSFNDEEYTYNNKGIIIPLYTDNTDEWNKIKEYNVSMVVILNPNNGPGYYQDEKYVNFIDTLNEKGFLPVGYVYTNYGKRDINEVEANIDKWIEFYPNIKGFFIDEVAANDDNYDYYSTLYVYIKTKYFDNYQIFLNPGIVPENEDFFNIADNIVIFENDYNFLYILDDHKDLLDKYEDKTSIIVHGVLTPDNIENIITNYPVKYYYITDSNTYTSLPQYFDLEVDLIYNIDETSNF